jgi:hypothetical protein
MLRMDPYLHRCCQHNWGHAWPYLAQHLWLATADGGLCAAFFVDSQVTARVRDARSVAIEEATHYPFDEQVNFRIHTQQPVRFPLYIRIPSWCRGAQLFLNGQPLGAPGNGPGFFRVERVWERGDELRVRFPMEVRIRRWDRNRGAVSVYRGPLAFSLKFVERFVKVADRPKWPAWEIHPATPWNYGLVLEEGDPGRSFEVIRKPWPEDDLVFTHEGTPVELRARAKRVPEWQLDEYGLVAELQDSPVQSDEPVELIALIPMGAARLRISAFPVIGTGVSAKRWKPRGIRPTPLPYHPTASHCWPADTVLALCDQQEARNSRDHRIPRMTWWDHRGTREWVQYEFGRPLRIRGVAVYWFDDEGFGQCRVPQAWRVLYRSPQGWREVQAHGPYTVDRDRYNKVYFEPIQTDSLKLEVQLRPGYSAGILEWKVLPEDKEAGTGTP